MTPIVEAEQDATAAVRRVEKYMREMDPLTRCGYQLSAGDVYHYSRMVLEAALKEHVFAAAMIADLNARVTRHCNATMQLVDKLEEAIGQVDKLQNRVTDLEKIIARGN